MLGLLLKCLAALRFLCHPQGRKTAAQVQRLEALHAKQQAVLRRKTEEAEAARKRLHVSMSALIPIPSTPPVLLLLLIMSHTQHLSVLLLPVLWYSCTCQ